MTIQKTIRWTFFVAAAGTLVFFLAIGQVRSQTNGPCWSASADPCYSMAPARAA